MKKSVFLLLIALSASLSASEPPKTEKIPVVNRYHGNSVMDTYQWLEDGTDKKVKEWEKKQAAYTTEKRSEHCAVAVIETRIDSLLSRNQYTGARIGETENFLIVRKHKGDVHSVIYLRKGKFGSLQELINPNKWAKGDKLRELSISPKGRFIAYTRERGGDESGTIHLIELHEDGSFGHTWDQFEGWRQRSLTWHPTEDALFYVAHPSASVMKEGEHYYWEGVYRHDIGTWRGGNNDLVFWQPTNAGWGHGIGIEDNALLIGRSGIGLPFEIYEIQLNDPSYKARLLFQGRNDMDQGYKEINGQIYRWTNPAAVELPFVEFLGAGFEWKPFIQLSNRYCRIEDLSGISGQLFLETMDRGKTQITTYNERGELISEIALPGSGTAVVKGSWNSLSAKVLYEDLATPLSLYDYDKRSGVLEFRDQIEIEGYAPEEYRSWVEEVTSEDGREILLFCAARKDLDPSKPHPTYLSAYGGYGVKQNPTFMETFIPWLEAGGILASPCIRGGGEGGHIWHEEGKLEKKQNVFNDFIASAELLIAKGYTTKELLGIQGGSNGGLLMGAVLTQRPDLFGAVVSSVGLYDMLRYHHMTNGRVQAPEFGIAEDSKAYRYLSSYSPYHNLTVGIEYPPTLLIAGRNDVRVDPWHSRKMAARMQELQIGSAPILLDLSASEGHFSTPGSQGYADKNARMFGFLAHHLGMDENFAANEQSDGSVIKNPDLAERLASIIEEEEGYTEEELLKIEQEKSFLERNHREIEERKAMSPIQKLLKQKLR